MARVVILQEYVPHYRVPFFEMLREKGRKLGMDITVAFGKPNTSLANRNDGQELTFGTHIHQREFQFLNRRLVLRDTKSVIADAELVILEQARRNVDAYRLLLSPRSSRPMIALWGHGKDYTRKASKTDEWLSRWLTSQADWFFAYTEGGKDAVVERGYDSRRVTVVQNSIDTSTLHSQVSDTTQAEVEEFCRKYDLCGKTALFLGALDSSKRLNFLLEAAVVAHSLDPDYRLVVAGDGEMRPEVENWSRIYGWIKYLGPINGAEKALVMSASQILASPGRVGLVAVDSFAAGLPIVTTLWPWHAPEYEYLKDGSNSLSTLDNPYAYAEKSVDLLNSPGRLAGLGKACMESVEVYTVEAMTDRFLQGVSDILALRSA